jgi:hypothetical protein
MTPALSEQQRAALDAEGGGPVPVVDERTQQLYYLVSADQFEQVRALFASDDVNPRDMYPLIAKTAGDAGWSDPTMDAYDHYDEHRPQS